MDNDDRGDDSVEESVVAKSTGQQEEKDIALKDAALYSVLTSKKKMTKEKAGYKEQEKNEDKETISNYNNTREYSSFMFTLRQFQFFHATI